MRSEGGKNYIERGRDRRKECKQVQEGREAGIKVSTGKEVVKKAARGREEGGRWEEQKAR